VSGIWEPSCPHRHVKQPLRAQTVLFYTASRKSLTRGHYEGWAGVNPVDSDDALRFAELRGVRAMIETYVLEKAAEAYARMMSGNA
jgi:D-arabinose 1-dehydrogenase-like Zn-dependent alcohol dehydrogenase